MNPRAAEPARRGIAFALLLSAALVIAAVCTLRSMLALGAALGLLAFAFAVWRPFWLLVAFVAIFPFAPYLAYPKLPFITVPKLLFALLLFGFGISLMLGYRRLKLAVETRVAIAWVALAFASLIWATDTAVGAAAAASLLGMVALMLLVAHFASDRDKLEAMVRFILLQCLAFSALGM
ncbi:MAG TPA: hypothetical protein ENF73_05965, partial [Proteobacteria bacterium]|nr:hypothetical protein [Pseudomonadota bacterium]